AIVTGSWSEQATGRYQPGTELPVRPGGNVDQAITTAKPVRVDRQPADCRVTRLGYAASLVAPVRVADRVWGALVVTATRPGAFGPEDEQRLTEFGDMLATAIASLEDRAKLAVQALTDPLTGLANHRALQERLAAESARSVRHGTKLSVALID